LTKGELLVVQALGRGTQQETSKAGENQMRDFRKLLVSLLVIAALLGFIWLFGQAIYLTIKSDTTPKFNDQYVYFANILVGLVGGIVAVGFGQAPPPGPNGGSVMARSAAGLGEIVASARAVRKSAQGTPPTPPSNTSEILGAIYAAVYVLLGLIAIGVWIYSPDRTPDVVKNLATVSLGMFVPIIKGFFTDQP
jgi:hypothetical protein